MEPVHINIASDYHLHNPHSKCDMISGMIAIIVTGVFCKRPQRKIDLDCNLDEWDGSKGHKLKRKWIVMVRVILKVQRV